MPQTPKQNGTTNNNIPPLTVYASARLPQQVIALAHPQVQRTTPTLSAHYYKKKGTVLGKEIPRGQALHRGRRQLRPPSPEDHVLRGFAQEMRRELGRYLEQQPAPSVPLESLLSTLSCLWVNGELSDSILQQFRASGRKFLVFNTHFYGGDRVALLLPFQKRTYLVLLEGRFTDYLDVLSAAQRTLQPDKPHRWGDLSFQMDLPLATALPRIPSHKILFATPLSPEPPSVKPKPPSLLLEPI